MASKSGIESVYGLFYIVNVVYGACQYINYIVRSTVETSSNFITVIIGEDFACGYNMFTDFTLYTTGLASCHLYVLLKASLMSIFLQIGASRVCHLNIFWVDGFFSSQSSSPSYSFCILLKLGLHGF